MSALTPRRPIESERITVTDVRRQHTIVALVAIGTALGLIVVAHMAGFIVGRFL